ncbi:hypothetical protein QBC47DRAFT_87868 [Echria macrotheca]|uniref:Plus3 domain-containing protein n=1 Tax=Echria macrotheca TaxID=438768 RepID=A0AAJ0B358_9PEZI|nr:hypothetical protein QBC47DRAFT_87868 [Echria macrotheca]
MSDIDDELLALAGGDVSSDEDEEMDMSRDESRSPSPPPASRKKEASSKGTAVKKTPAKAAKKRTRTDDESDEEGEAHRRFSHNTMAPANMMRSRSSGADSPSSQQSAPMDESDSDSDSPQTKPLGGDEELNPYPIDGLFRDYEEREHIMSLREIEREQILAERREENERMRQNKMLRQLKVNQDKDIKKRKASAAELDDDKRKTSRPRTKAGETHDKMDSLRRAREERSNRKEQRERESDRRKKSPSYRRSAGDDDADSEVEWMGPNKSKGKSRSPDAREGPPAELRDFERVRVGRSRFAEVCFHPGLEQALTGCFVRISIGPDQERGGIDVYRMAVIKGFTQGRAYAVADQSGKMMVVDLYVTAAHGKAVRDWPIIMCSNSAFTEAEFERYKRVCAAEGTPFPDKNALVRKIDDINKLLKRSFTDQELSEKLKRQNELHIKYSGVERDQVMKQLDHARARGDEAAIGRLQERLDKIEVPRLAFRTSLTPKKTENKGPSQQEKLALINLENRRRNAENVRKAQRMEIAKAREMQRRREPRQNVDEDHGRRLQTNETKKDGGNEAGKSGASTPANGTGTPSQKPTTVLPHIAKLQEQQRSQAKSGIPMIHKPLTDDDIIGALDLDIDVDLDFS